MFKSEEKVIETKLYYSGYILTLASQRCSLTLIAVAAAHDTTSAIFRKAGNFREWSDYGWLWLTSLQVPVNN